MIKLPNGWFIGADQYQYKIGNTTNTRVNKETGKEELVYVYKKYPSSLAEAFRAIIAAETRSAVDKEDMELGEALKKAQEISDFWVRVFQKALHFENEDYLTEKVKEYENG